MSLKTAALIALFGGVLAPIGDLFHVYSGTEGYPPDTRWLFGLPIPWWVPLEFAAASVAISFFALQAGGRVPKRLPVAALASVLALHCASGFLPLQSPWIDLVIGAAAVGTWLAFDRSLGGAVTAIGAAVTGPLIEATLIYLGVFRYYHPALGPVPSWLPWIYFSAGSALGLLARWLQDRKSGPAA